MNVPDWAHVGDGVVWDEVPREVKLHEWVQSMQPSIAGWSSHLPRDFREDYSRESLTTVEQTLLRLWPDPTADLTGSGSLILEDAGRYIGEALLRVCGGHWEWADHRAMWSDQPVIVPDTTDRRPIAPFVVVTDIVQRRSGNELSSLWDGLDELRRHRQSLESGWEPVKTPTPGLDRVPVPPAPELDAFLTDRDHDLSCWTQVSGLPATTWDLSLDSLDTLGQTVLDLGLTDAEVTNPGGGTNGFLAMRYLGETLIAVYGGTWEWRPNETGAPIDRDDSDTLFIERWMVRRDDPVDATYAFPDLDLAETVDGGGAAALRAAAARYAEIDE